MMVGKGKRDSVQKMYERTKLLPTRFLDLYSVCDLQHPFSIDR